MNHRDSERLIKRRMFVASEQKLKDTDIAYHRAPEWVTVSERLPERSKSNSSYSDLHICIVENENGEELVRRAFYDFGLLRWWLDEGGVQKLTVLMWLDMPLPPSPAKDKSNE